MNLRKSIVAGFLFFCGTLLWSDGPDLHLKLQGDALIETESGSRVNALFLVTNNTPVGLNLKSDVKIPTDWRIITGDTAISISPDTEKVKILSFFVPHNVVAGVYDVILTLSDSNKPDIRSSATMQVRVLPVVRLSVKPLETPLHVIAGEDYVTTFAVSNEGNTFISVSLNVEEYLGFNYEIVEGSVFDLSSGDIRIVEVLVRTDARLSKIIRHQAKLIARVVGEDIVAEAQSVTEVIPHSVSGADPFHRIPATLNLSQTVYQEKEWKAGVDVTITGKGIIDEPGEHILEFNVNKESDDGVIGDWQLSLWSKFNELQIGDHNFSIPALPEYNQNATGVSTQMNYGEISFGVLGHIIENSDLFESTAGFWSNLASSTDSLNSLQYSLSLGYLNKANAYEVAGIYGTFQPLADISTEGRIIWGQKSEGLPGNGYMFKFGVEHDLIFYTLAYNLFGIGYPGSNANSTSFKANAGLRLLSKSLILKGRYHWVVTNPHFAAESLPCSVNENLSTEISFSHPPSKTNLSLGIVGANDRSFLSNDSLDVWMHTVRFDARTTLDFVDLRFTGRVLQRGDDMSTVSSFDQQYKLETELHLSEDTSYLGYVSFELDTLADGTHAPTLGLGLSTQFQFAGRNVMDVDFKNLNFMGTSRERSDFIFDVGIKHILRNNNEISLRANMTSSYVDAALVTDLSLRVNYTATFGIPLSRKSNIGSLRGSIVDAENVPIPGVITRLDGLASITDREGRYSFPTVESGNYYLHLDKSTINLGQVSIHEMPALVTISDAATTTFDIRIIDAASISGTITLYAFESETDRFSVTKEAESEGAEEEYVKVSGFRNVLVELTDGITFKQRVPDTMGNFEFEELRSGKWTLKVSDAHLPEYHYFEEETFEIDLVPGERRHISIRVLPKRRRMLMIQEGITIE